MSELRIAYLSLQPTSEGQAGHAHVHEIIGGLRARGLRVDLFEPLYGGSPPSSALLRLVAAVTTQLRLAPRLRRYDVLYVRGHALALPISTLARTLGRVVLQECNGPYGDFASAWPEAKRFEALLTRLARAQYRKADVVIAVTDELASWLSHDTGRPVLVVPNGANTELFMPGQPRLSGLPGRYAVFFGALQPWQGISTLLAAVADPEWPSGLPVVFAGDGIQAAEVREAAARNPRLIRYIGQLPYNSVPRLVSNCVVSLTGFNTQPREGGGGSPLKLYESMACGVPVVGSNLPGHGDVIRQASCGVVVEPITPGNIARAVARVAGDPQAAREMGARGREAAVALHSWRARAECVGDIIEKAVAERKEGFDIST